MAPGFQMNQTLAYNIHTACASEHHITQNYIHTQLKYDIIGTKHAQSQTIREPERFLPSHLYSLANQQKWWIMEFYFQHLFEEAQFEWWAGGVIPLQNISRSSYHALSDIFTEDSSVVTVTFALLNLMHGNHTCCCLHKCYDTTSKQNTHIYLALNGASSSLRSFHSETEQYVQLLKSCLCDLSLRQTFGAIVTSHPFGQMPK